jgi:hypothetical protein
MATSVAAGSSPRWKEGQNLIARPYANQFAAMMLLVPVAVVSKVEVAAEIALHVAEEIIKTSLKPLIEKINPANCGVYFFPVMRFQFLLTRICAL